MFGLFSRLGWTRKSKKTHKKEIKQEKPKASSSANESVNSQSKTQTESVYNNGRRYQNYKDCAYILPNDDAEIDRLHLQHWIVKNAIGSNYSSPIEAELDNGIRVLDAGCGGCTWILEMASAYPNSKFTGIDVSAAWPTEIRPHNCDFVVGNIVDELPFEENSFDYIYMRLVAMGVPNEVYPTVLSQLHRVLKPGGWLEVVEMDGNLVYKGKAAVIFWNAVLQYLKSRGFKDGIVRDLDLKFADAGFVNVDGMIIKIPVGNWGGKLGEVFIEDAIASYKSMQPIVQPILGYTDEQYQELIDNILRESNEVKEVGHFVMNWAQKPAN